MSQGLEHFRNTGDVVSSAEVLIKACSEDDSELVGSKIDDPKRSIERLVEIFSGYCAEYPNEPKTVIQPETPFEIFIDSAERIIFRGVIDVVIEMADGSPAIIEDKTTSRLGETFFRYHKDSPQVLWYLRTADQLGLFTKPKSSIPKAIINAIYIHPTQFRFERDIAIKPRRILDESYHDMLDWISEILSAEELNFYPRNFCFCHEYGGCDYLLLRDLDPQSTLYARVLEANYKVKKEESTDAESVDE